MPYPQLETMGLVYRLFRSKSRQKLLTWLEEAARTMLRAQRGAIFLSLTDDPDARRPGRCPGGPSGASQLLQPPAGAVQGRSSAIERRGLGHLRRGRALIVEVACELCGQSWHRKGATTEQFLECVFRGSMGRLRLEPMPSDDDGLQLVSLGIEAARITIITYGEKRPLYKDHAETCWTQNRQAHSPGEDRGPVTSRMPA